MTSRTEVENAIKKSLYEWGLRPSRGSIHQFAEKTAIEKALKHFTGKACTSYPPEDTEAFSGKLIDAFKYVLRNEIDSWNDDMIPVIIDLLGESTKYDIMFYRPYFFNKYKKRYDKSRSFEPFRDIELDPFRRFVKKEVPGELFIHDLFNSDAYINGMLFETIIVHHMICNNHPCVNCGRCGGFSWSGGLGSSWMDMFCKYCKSTYEIKSKTSVSHIDRLFEINDIHGGSFAGFHCLKRKQKEIKEQSLGSCIPKPFLVLVSREVTWPKKGPGYWEVDVVEIKSILPEVPFEFFPLITEGSVKSKIETLRRTRKVNWLKIPAVKANWKAIAQSVYEDFFPEVEWDKAESRFKEFLAKAPAEVYSLEHDNRNTAPLSDESTDISFAKKNNSYVTNSNDKTPLVEDLSKKLEDLEVADDWEDLIWNC